MTTTLTSASFDSDHQERPPRSRRVFHGWKIVGAGAVIQTLHSGLILQAFSHYAVMIEQQFGWSKTVISTAYSFNRAESGLLGPLHGWLLHRFGSRRVMRVGSAILVIGLLLFSRIQTPVQFVAAFFLIAVGASLSGFLTLTSETVKWFERRRARALSLTMAGFAIGGLATPGLVWFMTTFGWRTTAVASAVIVGVTMIPISRLYGHSPTSLGQPVDGFGDGGDPETRRRPKGVSDHHFTVREALRTRAFWFLSLGHAAALLVTGAVIAHLALFLTTERGLSLQAASYAGAGLTAVQLVGIVGGGFLGDRLDKRLVCAIAMLGHAFGLLVLTYGVGLGTISLFVLLHGSAWGVRGPLMNAMRADYFGTRFYGQIMGVSSVIVMVGMVGGPLLAGFLADASGDYRLGFTILALLAGTGTLLVAAATPPAPPDRRDAPAATNDRSA